MQTPDYSISTPENVDLHLELAGIGNRILANLIDFAISSLFLTTLFLFGVILYVAITFSGAGDATKDLIKMVLTMIGIFVYFFVSFCYQLVFEGIWQGQTPGKRVAQIRVIESNGQPVGWGAVFIRNIIRVFDTWACLIGLLFMLVNKSEKRLGDLAAGTLVIRERKSDLSVQDIKLITGAREESLLDIGRLSPQEYDLLARFLKRREKMAESHRPLVAKRLEDYFRSRLGEESKESQETSSEAFLETVFASYRARALE